MIKYEKGIQKLKHDYYAFMAPNGDWGQTNAGIILSDDDLLLIDTFWTLPATQELLDGIRSRFPAHKITTLINTHHDGDHWWGNQLLGSDVEIIASQKFMDYMGGAKAVKPDYTSALKSKFHGCGSPLCNYVDYVFGEYDFSQIALRFPNRTFSGELLFSHGAKELTLKDDLGNAHSGSDSIIFSSRDKIIYTGDLIFFLAHIVMWIGPIETWIGSAKRILAFDADVFVPDHGPVLHRNDVEN